MYDLLDIVVVRMFFGHAYPVLLDQQLVFQWSLDGFDEVGLEVHREGLLDLLDVLQVLDFFEYVLPLVVIIVIL